MVSCRVALLSVIMPAMCLPARPPAAYRLHYSEVACRCAADIHNVFLNEITADFRVEYFICDDDAGKNIKPTFPDLFF